MDYCTELMNIYICVKKIFDDSIGFFYNILVEEFVDYSLYPQTRVGDILDSGPSRRRRRNFLVDAITQKQINIFFQTWYTC